MNWENKYINKIVNIDCLEGMKELPDGCIDLVVTDPPYGVDYDGGHFHSGNVDIKRTREKLRGDSTCSVYEWLFPEIKRLLKRGGIAYIFYAASKSKEIYKHLCFDKYQMLIWNKTNATFASIMARYHHVFEPILYVQKEGAATTWNGGSKERSMLNMKRDSENKFHPTQKPASLIGRLIFNSSNMGDLVCDPMCGSGTTLVAAKQLGRKFIGMEINPDYVAIAEERLKQEVLKL